MPKYDYLIVGSGLFGAVFAHQARKHGKTCLVIDRRTTTGGNTYCENRGGINVHKYGPHIFHTNDKAIWDFVNTFVSFHRFTYSPLAFYKGKLYNLPFNMNTFHQVWGTQTPAEAVSKIEEQITASAKKIKPQNLEEQAISLVGVDIYNMFIKGYTEKQWGRSATDLPAQIITRVPVRFTFDNNYFNDKYQGIPVGGYNVLLNALLQGVETRTNICFLKNKAELAGLASSIVYTGAIDEYFDYQFGALEYRSLRFETEELLQENYQGVAVVNYTEKQIPYTRIIEHKHFEFGTQKTTVITREYPEDWKKGAEPYYPVNDEKNNLLYRKYKALADQEASVIFGGRLAEYKYYDMHQVIGSAMAKAELELSK